MLAFSLALLLTPAAQAGLQSPPAALPSPLQATQPPTCLTCSPPGERVSYITNPRWAVAPRPDYPEVAWRNGSQGAVIDLYCMVRRDGTLFDCTVISDSAPGQGFLEAAVTAANQARLERSSDIVWPETGTVRFNIRFGAVPPQ